MEIKKFIFEKDYNRIINFLTECYKENKNMTCWLPQRFDDLVYRVDTLYRDERNKLPSQEFIYYWEENNNIVAIIFPDGDSCNTSIKKGYEYLFKEMLDLAEQKLLPLFTPNETGKIDFLVIAHDSLDYKVNELIKRGYKKGVDSDYDNYQYPSHFNEDIILPNGFKQVYGEGLIDHQKSKACHYGFKPQDDDGILDGPFKEGSLSYCARKKSMYFSDSFESLTITDEGDICSYSFCYVDKNTSTAFIEPVSTREKYRKKGLGKAMLQGIIKRLKEQGIEKCYVNSYALHRKQFYNKAGFITEDSIGFWTKEL